jgi:hypothetical protein
LAGRDIEKQRRNSMGLFTRDYSGNLTWENLKNEGGPQYTYRTKVPGGWLVATENYTASCGGLTFFPDPKHEWDGNSA